MVASGSDRASDRSAGHISPEVTATLHNTELVFMATMMGEEPVSSRLEPKITTKHATSCSGLRFMGFFPQMIPPENMCVLDLGNGTSSKNATLESFPQKLMKGKREVEPPSDIITNERAARRDKESK